MTNPCTRSLMCARLTSPVENPTVITQWATARVEPWLTLP
jgi:hypothetical protein